MGVEVGFPAGVKELTVMVKRKPVVGELMTIFRDNSGFSELANRWALYLENSKSYTDWTTGIDGSRGRLFDIDEVLDQERMLLNEYGSRLSSHLIDFDFIQKNSPIICWLVELNSDIDIKTELHAGFEASLEADGYQLKRDQDGYVLWKKTKNRDGAVLYRKKGKYHGLDSLGEGDNGESGGSNDGEFPLDEGVLYVEPGLNGDGGKGSQNGNGRIGVVDAKLEVEDEVAEHCGGVVVESEPEVKTRLVVKAEDFWPGLSGDNTQRLALKLEGMLRNGGVEWEVAKHNKRTEETVVKLTGRDRSVCVISEKNFRNAIGDQELDLESLLQNMSSRLYVDLDGVDAPVVSRFVRITQEQLNDSTPLSDLMNWLVNQDQKRNSQAPWGSIMVSPDPDTQGIYKMKPANRPRQRDVYFSRSTLLDSMGFKVLNNETGAVSSWISPRGLVIDASMSDERFIEILNELQIVYNDKEFSPQFELVK